MQYTDIGTTWRKLSLISGHARRDPGFRFTSLAHLLDVEFLRDCYESLNRNKAVGIDGVSWYATRMKQSASNEGCIIVSTNMA